MCARCKQTTVCLMLFNNAKGTFPLFECDLMTFFYISFLAIDFPTLAFIPIKNVHGEFDFWFYIVAGRMEFNWLGIFDEKKHFHSKTVQRQQWKKNRWCCVGVLIILNFKLTFQNHSNNKISQLVNGVLKIPNWYLPYVSILIWEIFVALVGNLSYSN